jgi:hypothetical protein
MVLSLCNAQKVAQARTPVLTLEGCEHVPAIYRSHYPKPTFSFDLKHIGCPDQMTIAEPTVLIFTLVAKNHTDTCARLDRNPTKVCGDRHIKALLLSFNDPLEIEICVALSVKIYIYRVEHHCAPELFRKALSGIPHGTICAGIVWDSW